MNKQLWSLRGLNFSFYATTGVLNPFLPIYLEARGYTSAQIGLLMMIGPFITIFAQPMWGYISDRYQALKTIVFSLWAMTLLSSFGIFGSTSYTFLFMFMLLLYFFLLSSQPLLDTLSIRVAQRADATYGSIRLWGSIGFMLLSMSTGFLLDVIGGIDHIAYLYWGIWLLPFLFLLLARNEKGEGNAVVSLSAFGQMLKNKQFVWFLFLVFILMVPHRMNDSLLALYMKDLGATDVMVGWAWALAAGSEIPTLALLARYLTRFHELALLGVVSILYTVRWFLYGYLDDPFMLMMLQASHSITFAVFWITAVQYVVRLVPSHLQSTGQSLLAMIFLGLAGITGGYAGGYVKDWLGGDAMYYIGAVFAAVSAVLFLGTHSYLRKHNDPAV
ncbi:MFS transporter [Paenibacillus sp. YYML68]|uniref:MFS transporter n=1 Tax=Paenibacillus sp. YYML68 TaxID=2909250 RepID=UPI002493A848|nr:MFS transporter [Paenibacillus sp. YYML68]